MKTTYSIKDGRPYIQKVLLKREPESIVPGSLTASSQKRRRVFHRCLASIVIGFFSFWLLSLPEMPLAEAGAISTNILITVVIRARADVKVISEPSAITIGEHDVTRGFVDINNASLVEFRTNSDACLLTVSIRSDLFKEVYVNIAGREVVVGQKGGIIVVPVNKRLTAPVNYRFVLAEGVRSGNYEWPVRLSVNPL